MSLPERLFWPPLQPVWHARDGHVAPMTEVMRELEARHGVVLRAHPDFVDGLPTLDVLGFLEERVRELGLPPPEDVFARDARERSARGLPAEVEVGDLVFWTRTAATQSPRLRAFLLECEARGPFAFERADGEVPAPGLRVLGWAALAAGAVALGLHAAGVF